MWHVFQREVSFHSVFHDSSLSLLLVFVKYLHYRYQQTDITKQIPAYTSYQYNMLPTFCVGGGVSDLLGLLDYRYIFIYQRKAGRCLLHLTFNKTGAFSSNFRRTKIQVLWQRKPFSLRIVIVTLTVLVQI